MKSLHASYTSSFVKFAEASLENSTRYKEIVAYANSLNEKANELLLRATLNKDIDSTRLQRVLFQTGGEYIHKFACKFSNHKITNNMNGNL